MRIAMVATPAPLPDMRPAPGFLDGDLVRARAPLPDTGFRVIDLDPGVDLAEQIEGLFDGGEAPRDARISLLRLMSRDPERRRRALPQPRLVATGHGRLAPRSRALVPREGAGPGGLLPRVQAHAGSGRPVPLRRRRRRREGVRDGCQGRRRTPRRGEPRRRRRSRRPPVRAHSRLHRGAGRARSPVRTHPRALLRSRAGERRHRGRGALLRAREGRDPLRSAPAGSACRPPSLAADAPPRRGRDRA